MRLLVVSHKECWPSPGSPSGHATNGGFPLQMAALSELFDAVTVCVPVSAGFEQPNGAPLTGRGLAVSPLPAPQGSGAWRKVRFIAWSLGNLPALLREARRADAVHALIPGDVGTLGIVVAHLLRKPLVVRHCGNWTAPRTLADRAWRAYMERAGTPARVMLATGGAGAPPSERNPNVAWIFSTAMRADQIRETGRCRGRAADGPRLVTVGRQTEAKGAGRIVRALPLLHERYPSATLDVIGDGPALESFRALAVDLGVAGAVHFHGALGHDGVIDVLDRSDVFVFPTTSSEGFPKAVHEAMARGLPVVSSPVSVLGGLVAGCGVVVEDVEPPTIADAVERVWGDEAQFALFSLAAIERATAYTLEEWQRFLERRLSDAWGRPLRTGATAMT